MTTAPATVFLMSFWSSSFIWEFLCPFSNERETSDVGTPKTSIGKSFLRTCALRIRETSSDSRSARSFADLELKRSRTSPLFSFVAAMTP